MQINLGFVLLVVFMTLLILKIGGYMAISWLVVFMPIILGCMLLVTALALLAIVVAIAKRLH